MVNTADFLLSAGADDAICLIDDNGRHTYRELRSAVASVMESVALLDLEPGSAVGLVGANSLFWVAGYLAVMKLNLVAVPFAATLTTTELASNAQWVRCRGLLMDRANFKRREGALPAGLPVIQEEASSVGGDHCLREPTITDPDSDAALMFTSGTTSRPRVVRVTHRNIQSNTESIITYLGLGSDDRMMATLRFTYCFGASLLHTHLRVGASLVLADSFVFPELTLSTMRRERCTGFAGVPSSFHLLLRSSSFGTSQLPDLRTIQQAGGRLPDVLIEELLEAQPQARLFVMYGQTEATARLSYLPPELIRVKSGSIGRGIPGVRLRVLREDGTVADPGETGELCAQGENISPGYLNDPEATLTRFHDGELHTGDLATADDDGFIYIRDRKEDFIKAWGFRVSSQEVEDVAMELPSLVAAAAIAVPDLEAGERVELFAVPHPDSHLPAEDVVTHCRRRLPRHMVPRQVHFVSNLPLNASGKVSKSDLRSLAAASTEIEPAPDGRGSGR